MSTDKNKKRRKKLIIKITIIVAAATAAAVWLALYLSHTYWVGYGGSSGYYCKDTYLDGGTWQGEYSKKTRVHVVCSIEAGGICIEYTDKAGNIAAKYEYTESGEYLITFDNDDPLFYYDHHYALTEDTVAAVETHKEIKESNFDWIYRKIQSELRFLFYGW